MNFKFVLTFFVLLKTLNASLIDTTAGDVNNIQPNVQRLLQAESDDGWENGVQQFEDGCEYVADRLPSGTYDQGQNVLSSIKTFTDKLKELADNDSTILSTRSVAILYILSTEQTLGESPQKILKEVKRLLPSITSSHVDVTESLEPNLGVQPTSAVADSMNELETALSALLSNVGDDGIRPEDIPNLNFEPTTRALQKLTSTIALISETALNGPSATSDVLESLTVLSLSLEHFTIKVQGSLVCIAAIIQNQSQDLISQTLNALLQAINSFLTGITNAILSIVNAAVATLVSVLQTLIAITDTLNATVNSILGLVGNLVTITVRQITRSLSSVTNGIFNILRLLG